MIRNGAVCRLEDLSRTSFGAQLFVLQKRSKLTSHELLIGHQPAEFVTRVVQIEVVPPLTTLASGAAP
jgi:hypothetical protein